MREIKFRVWNLKDKEMREVCGLKFDSGMNGDEDNLFALVAPKRWLTIGSRDGGILLQYTGLKDKNGKEIYELCELNNRYIVTYKAPCFCLYEITTGDIMPLDEEFKWSITKEYSPLPQNTKRSID